jgi:hypothetical protein
MAAFWPSAGPAPIAVRLIGLRAITSLLASYSWEAAGQSTGLLRAHVGHSDAAIHFSKVGINADVRTIRWSDPILRTPFHFRRRAANAEASPS